MSPLLNSVLQLVFFVIAIGALVAFGFMRDKKEHTPPPAEDTDPNLKFDFSGSNGEERHRGAAMSRLS
jgi:fructose-specific phosphotransferase system IIC component